MKGIDKMENGVSLKKKEDSFSWLHLVLNNKAFILLFIMFVVSTIISPLFFDVKNIVNVIRQIAAPAIVAIGFTCTISSGNIDLSVGHMLGMIGVVMALLSKTSMPFPLVLLSGILLGALCGFINGFVGVTFKLPLFIVTLATGQVFSGATLLLSNSSPVNDLNPAFKVLGQEHWGPIPIPIYIMFVVAIIIYIILNKTSFGRYAIATGGNREAARTSGINVNKITIMVYMLMGVCIAIGSIVLTGRAFSAQPLAGKGMEMDAIAAVVIGGTPLSGGKGNVVGTVFGCMLVGIINNILNLTGVDTNWQVIAKGLLILFAVLLDVLSSMYFENRLKRAE